MNLEFREENHFDDGHQGAELTFEPLTAHKPCVGIVFLIG